MKKAIFLLIALVFFTSTLKADNWLYSFEDAKKLALSTDKLILVDFWATWCGPCKRMDSESWSKDDVKLLMNNYVPVKIDIDAQKSLANKYGVKGIPFIFIMDGNGKVLYKQMSYKKKNEVLKLLKKYAINTSFLRQNLISYFKKPSYISSFRLASKYQDFSLHIEDNTVKRDFLRASSSYFDESKKFLKKSDFQNKKAFLQKIDLLEIQEFLILNKPEKAIKKLSKLDDTSLDKMNTSLYNFLNYVACKQSNDEEGMKKYEEKVTERDMKKVNLFIKQV